MLADADVRGIDRIACLGDIVGYGPDPDECVALIAARSVPCVRGNHDAVAAGLKPPIHFGQRASHAIRWTRRHISECTRRALAAYPMTLLLDDRTMLVHAALHPRPNDVLRIRSEADALQTIEALRRDHPRVRLCFFGHTHLPAAYRWDGARVTRVHGDTVNMTDDATYLINPGSVGWPRESPERACYITYDDSAGVVAFHRVSYDREAFERRIAAAGLNHVSTRLGQARCWVRDRFHEASAAVSRLRVWCSA